MKKTLQSNAVVAELDNEAELPEGWASTSLANVIDFALGGEWGSSPDQSVSSGSASVSVIRGTEFRNWVRDRGSTAAERLVNKSSLAKRELQQGDIIVEISGGGPDQPVGRTLVIDKEARAKARHPLICSNFCRQVRLHASVNPFYVDFIIKRAYWRGEIDQYQTQSTNLRNLNFPEFIAEFPLLVAPSSEQERIVSKLNQLLAQVNVSHDRLERVPRILKAFRQSVFDSAIRGNLTSDWRRSTQLGACAKSELESLLAATESRRRKREAEPTEGHETLIEAIPEEWASPSLDDLFQLIDYRGKTPKKSGTGKRLISAKNIKMGHISEEPVEYVSEEAYRTWMTRGFPKKGDIFFVTEGHTMGFAALNNRDDEFALAQRTITLQPWQSVETRCFLFFIMSPIFQNLVRLNATGSAAVGIKGARFRGLPIPFPTFAEQREIVRRVEALFKLADTIEKRVEGATKRADKLTQSILAKAFRGELVPTEAELARKEDRTYEPASELLARIRANCEGSTATKPAADRKPRPALANKR